MNLRRTGLSLLLLLAVLNGCHTKNTAANEPRAAATRAALREIHGEGRGPDAVPSPATQGRMAASELAEPVHGLSPSMRDKIKLLSDNSVADGQRAAIIGRIFEDEAQLSEAFDHRCAPGLTAKALKGKPESERRAEVIRACKIADSAAARQSMAMALAVAVAVEAVLEQRGDVLDGEREIARTLALLN